MTPLEIEEEAMTVARDLVRAMLPAWKPGYRSITVDRFETRDGRVVQIEVQIGRDGAVRKAGGE